MPKSKQLLNKSKDKGINVDNTKKSLSFLSICAGYGGIEIGVERSLAPVALNPVAFVEIEAFAIANLVAKMEAGILDPTPFWTDLKTFHAHSFRDKVDILIGGYPCQPFSAAGLRQGENDPRHLWPWIRNAIAAIRPGICFFENVEGHISLGLREVLTDLAKLGYRVENDCGEPTWGLFSAAEVGAPHQRKRVFIMAYRDLSWFPSNWDNGRMGREWKSYQELANPKSGRLQTGQVDGECLQECNRERRNPSDDFPETKEPGFTLWPARPGQPQYKWEEPRVLADTECKSDRTKKRYQTQKPNAGRSTSRTCGQGNGNMADPMLYVKPEKRGTANGWEQTSTAKIGESFGCGEKSKVEPELGGTTHGSTSGVDTTSNHVDRLRLCGNGVNPDTAENAFTVLINRIINPEYIQPSIQLELF